MPHAEITAVGIDLGTTHSVVALLDASGVPQAIAGEDGSSIVPSVVGYRAGARIVGASATGTLVRSIKRLMGKSSDDVSVRNVPYVVPGSSPLKLAIDGEMLSPEEISADILRHLKRNAEHALGKEVSHAVITVPAYFNDAQRLATKHAAQLAGLEVLRLINEPTAAALAYGLDQQAEGTYAVYDLGGGTFDISILKLQGGVFQVLSTAGDTQLGGDDIDQAIAARLCKDWDINPDAETMARLRVTCRKAKEALSETNEFSGEFDSRSFSFSRAMLHEVTSPIIARTLACCEHAMMDASIDAAAIDGVVLVGGSTRMPAVKQAVAGYFGKTPLDSVDPDRVVAYGAAIQAAALTQGADHLLLDVVPLSLGLETMGGIVEKIIHRNSPIPCNVAQEFTTYVDGQTAISMHIVQGEREQAKDCRSLARFELTGIPPMKAGLARVRVEFHVDADGLLSVSAQEATRGVKQQVDVKPTYGLNVDDMASMLEDAMKHARSDISERLLIESRVEAQRVILEVESALSDTPDLLKPGEEAMIRAQIKSAQEACGSDNRETMDYELARLHEIVGPFAERRMNAAIASNLSGKHVANV